MPLHDVTIQPLRPDHVPDFLLLAAKEGWSCQQWEFDFLFERFPQGCWVALESARAAGFVTAVTYEKSGWVGNLLVREELRGHGLGRALMRHTLSSLNRAGVETTWLTASPDGRPLYEALGFSAIDRIIRWRGRGGCGQGGIQPSYSLPDMAETDRMGWGDRRASIVRNTAERGIVASEKAGFCTLQMAGDGLQVGPWGCRSSGVAEGLLQKALAAVEPQPGGIFLDVPEANREAAAVLKRHGIAECGETVLMYRGRRPAYRPECIFALATMGSMG